MMVFCAVEKAKATATFGMPVSTSLSYSHYLQIVLISIRQKKRSDSTKEEKLDVPPFLILIHHERV